MPEPDPTSSLAIDEREDFHSVGPSQKSPSDNEGELLPPRSSKFLAHAPTGVRTCSDDEDVKAEVHLHGPPSTATTISSGHPSWTDLTTVEEHESSTPSPPPNFCRVASGIYRSSFPMAQHFPYLRQLNLKSILTLVAEDYPDDNVSFMAQHDIQHFQVPIPGNKDAADISTDDIMTALSILLQAENLPILVHCNKGRHRTGCVIACLRKVQGWSLSSVLEEYRQYAHPKARVADEQLIRSFDESRVLELYAHGGSVGRGIPSTRPILSATKA